MRLLVLIHIYNTEDKESVFYYQVFVDIPIKPQNGRDPMSTVKDFFKLLCYPFIFGTDDDLEKDATEMYLELLKQVARDKGVLTRPSLRAMSFQIMG